MLPFMVGEGLASSRNMRWIKDKPNLYGWDDHMGSPLQIERVTLICYPKRNRITHMMSEPVMRESARESRNGGEIS